jgi:hypothetical protein
MREANMMWLLMLGIAMMMGISPAYPAPPHTTQWYIIDPQEAKCETAREAAIAFDSPTLLTPYTTETGLRNRKEWAQTKIIRDDDGTILTVAVTSLDGLSITFFPTMEMCEKVKERALKDGRLNHPDDLK